MFFFSIVLKQGTISHPTNTKGNTSRRKYVTRRKSLSHRQDWCSSRSCATLKHASVLCLPQQLRYTVGFESIAFFIPHRHNSLWHVRWSLASWFEKHVVFISERRPWVIAHMFGIGDASCRQSCQLTFDTPGLFCILASHWPHCLCAYCTYHYHTETATCKIPL